MSSPSYSHFSTVLYTLPVPVVYYFIQCTGTLFNGAKNDRVVNMIYVYHFVAVIVGLLLHSLSLDSTVVNTDLREQLKTAKVMLCAIVKQEDLYIE
jgi:hypothetical protein